MSARTSPATTPATREQRIEGLMNELRPQIEATMRQLPDRHHRPHGVARASWYSYLVLNVCTFAVPAANSRCSAASWAGQARNMARSDPGVTDWLVLE